MASISTATSFGGTPGGTAVSGCAPAAGSAAPGVTDASGAENSDGFMQLLSGMLNGEPAGAQSSAPSLQDLAAMMLGADGSEAAADLADTDSDTDSDPDSDASDEAGALAMAALLPGMCLNPAIANSAALNGGSGSQSADLTSAITAARVGVDAATDELTGEATDAAGNAQSTTSTDSTAATNAPNSSSHLHSLLASHRLPDADAVPDAAVRSPVGTPQWKDELGAQLTFMALNGRETASLKLSPENLGPLEIRISMKDGEASVWFGATNPETRTALEQSMPRLREMFASSGLVLGDSGVSRDSPRNQFKPGPFSGSPRGSSDADAGASVKSITLARLGLLDTYV